MFRLTPVVKNLLILNVGFFIIQYLTGGPNGPFTHYLSLYDISSNYFYPHQFLTHMFLHGDFYHLLFNMLPIIFFAPHLENLYGPKKFMIFYLVCGLGAAILYSITHHIELQMLMNEANALISNPNGGAIKQFIDENGGGYMLQRSPHLYETLKAFDQNPGNAELKNASIQIVERFVDNVQDIPMLGASGAVFGILMGAALYFPNATVVLFPIPIPIKIKYLVAVYAFFEITQGLNPVPGDNVAHFAHIGGMIFAYIMYRIWRGKV